MTALLKTHKAILNSTTLYQKNIFNPKDYKFKAIKASTNKKLGKKVTKGKLKNAKMYTLTLVERETCSKECEHYLDCYGNNMPFAHRIKANDSIYQLLDNDLNELDKKNKPYLIRLHVLGDFFSVDYVNYWKKQLETRPNLNIYGYTRYHTTMNDINEAMIGLAIDSIRVQYPYRFMIRFSNDTTKEFSAHSEEITTNGIACPVQEDKTDSCGTCTLCWTVNKPIIFKTH